MYVPKGCGSPVETFAEGKSTDRGDSRDNRKPSENKITEVHTMKANYNVTGAARKALVSAISNITGDKAIYKLMPTCAYEIGDITVSKEGCVICEDADKLNRLMHNLIADGFAPEATEEAAEAPVETASKDDTLQEKADKGAGLTVALPLDCADVGNLTNLLESKGSLIKKALDIGDLGFSIENDKISFPWFEAMLPPDEIKTYLHFVAALCKLSKDQKRINAAEKPVDNEKYAFRCFLLRLGFIGNEYKAERKILLKNLSGNSSWKNGAPEKEAVTCE